MRISFSYRNYENSRIASVISALNSILLKTILNGILLLGNIGLMINVVLSNYVSVCKWGASIYSFYTIGYSVSLLIPTFFAWCLLMLAVHIIDAFCFVLDNREIGVIDAFKNGFFAEAKLWWNTLKTAVSFWLGLYLLFVGLAYFVAGVQCLNSGMDALGGIVIGIVCVALPAVVCYKYFKKRKKKRQDDSASLSSDI